MPESSSVSRRPVRVLVVDDHPVLRAGVASMLAAQDGVAVCGEAGDGESAVAQYEALRPDVTLMDLQMPGLDGPGAIAKIRARDPNACVMVLTTFDTDTDVVRALRAGARGYLLKDAGVQELADAIRAVHSGRTKVASAVAERLPGLVNQVELTVRELSVLRLLADGKTNKEIGAALGIVESTVKVHVNHFFDKLGVTSRTEAIAVGVRRGLVRLR